MSHVTRTPLSRSKVKVTRPLYSARRKAAAAASVGPYSAWESTATLRLLGGARGAWAPTGGGEGRGHIVSPRAQLVIVIITIICRLDQWILTAQC